MTGIILREIEVFMKSSEQPQAPFYCFQLLSGLKIPGNVSFFFYFFLQDAATLSLFFKICFDRFAHMVRKNQLNSKTVALVLGALNKKLPFVDRTVSSLRLPFLEFTSALILRRALCRII